MSNKIKRMASIKMPFTCPITNKVFVKTMALAVYLTKELRTNHKEYFDKYIYPLNIKDKTCFFCGNEGKFIGATKGYSNLCEKEECFRKSYISNSIEGIRYRLGCSLDVATALFENKKHF